MRWNIFKAKQNTFEAKQNTFEAKQNTFEAEQNVSPLKAGCVAFGRGAGVKADCHCRLKSVSNEDDEMIFCAR